jgi:hypothetical protein
MKTIILELIIIILITCSILLLNACNQLQEVKSPTPSATTGPALELTQVRWGDIIEISGKSNLKDGTQLQTQCFPEGHPDQPIQWWPKDLEVKNGWWMLTVYPSDYGVPKLGGSGYIFKLWVKNNPSISLTHVIDLVGPPSIVTNKVITSTNRY